MNWELVLPELVLSCAGLAILLFGVIPKRDMTFPCAMAVIGALLLTGVLVLAQGEGTAFGGQYVADDFAGFMKLLALGAAALTLLLALDWNEKEGLSRFEFPELVLFATVGEVPDRTDFRSTLGAGMSVIVLTLLPFAPLQSEP